MVHRIYTIPVYIINGIHTTMIKNTLETHTFCHASQSTKGEEEQSEVFPVHDRISFLSTVNPNKTWSPVLSEWINSSHTQFCTFNSFCFNWAHRSLKSLPVFEQLGRCFKLPCLLYGVQYIFRHRKSSHPVVTYRPVPRGGYWGLRVTPLKLMIFIEGVFAEENGKLWS